MITKCICCENSEENNFINFNYSKNCSMNYPIEMEGAIIKYCKNCSFAFCSKHISSDRLNLYYKKYYNGKSVKSDSHLENSIIRKYFYDERSISQISLINQFMDIDNLNILDIGSGSGLFYLQLNRIGFEKTTKNIIEPQIKNHEWYKKNNINIIEESIFHINEKHNNSFDLIFLSHSLEHFDSISVNTLITNIYKLLNKNGKIFIEVPNADLEKFKNSNENMQPHLSFFTKKSLNKLLKKNNFEILFSGTFGESQFTKKNIELKNTFYLNSDDIYIHKESELTSIKTINKRKFLNNILYLLTIIFPKKFIIFLKDFYNLFIKKNNLLFSSREFKFNKNDGEFLRIIAEKNNE